MVGVFSVICLMLIPMPTFILGIAMFIHMLRDDRDSRSAKSFVTKLILIFSIGLFALGGVFWVLMCLSLLVRGAIV